MIRIPEIENDFDTLGVWVGRALTPEEVERVSGCIGYALRSTLAGESLSEPVSVWPSNGGTYLTYWFDSTKSQRDDPDLMGALRLAGDMVQAGSPIRKTNRAGQGTAGTRLVQGIGPVDVAFEVDIDVNAPHSALAALNAARDALNAAQHAFAQAAIQYAKAGA